jgi:NADH-quinone oxidoreductase subunit L
MVGIGIAALFYRKENERADKAVILMKGFYNTVYHKFYIDELYIFITKNIIFRFLSRPFAWFDRNIVDATMNGIGNGMTFTSEKIKKMQSGQLQQYAAIFFAGTILLILLVMLL